MKNYHSWCGILILCILFTASIAHAGVHDIAISEVLFNPMGVDTGAEYIVLKNFGTEDINITGWNLYPDGIGYFTFPTFTLSAGKLVKVFLRTTGTATNEMLYDASGSGNLGNSSGSIALFLDTTHSSSTLVSFVRYHTPGTVEHKTWESAAAGAHLWTSRTFIDITQAVEGQILTLKDFSQKTNPQGWVFAPAPNISTKQNISQEVKPKTNALQSKSDQQGFSRATTTQNFDTSFVDQNTTHSSELLWLVVGAGVGAGAGILFLIFKKITSQN